MNPSVESASPVLTPYAGAVLAVLGALVVAHLLADKLPDTTLSLVFLTSSLVIANRSGPGPSLFASVVGFLSYVYFFVQPYHSFAVEREDLPMMGLFLAVTLLTVQLAARTRTQADNARRAAERAENLYAVSRRLATSVGADAVLAAVVDHLSTTLGCGALALVRGPGGLEMRAPIPTGLALDQSARNAATQAWEGIPAPVGAWRFLPLDAPRGRMALIALRLARERHIDHEQQQLIEAVRDQAALALERTLLAGDLEQARVLSETEQLRSALLSSVSHDLRTPLASIIGSTGSLLSYGDSFAPADRAELLKTVLDEAERLNRYIQNLLDMTRLGHGAIKLERDWTDLRDIVAAALERLRSPLSELRVELKMEADLPLLYVHGALIEQVLVNLLDNAAEHSPAGATITVTAHRTGGDAITVDVIDEGPGIPEADRERVFDMFYSVKRGDRQTRGVGLGLAICRGLIGAHGGTVTAHAGTGGRGTCMRITLPLGTKSEVPLGDGEQP